VCGGSGKQGSTSDKRNLNWQKGVNISYLEKGDIEVIGPDKYLCTMTDLGLSQSSAPSSPQVLLRFAGYWNGFIQWGQLNRST